MNNDTMHFDAENDTHILQMPASLMFKDFKSAKYASEHFDYLYKDF